MGFNWHETFLRLLLFQNAFGQSKLLSNYLLTVVLTKDCFWKFENIEFPIFRVIVYFFFLLLFFFFIVSSLPLYIGEQFPLIFTYQNEPS